MVCNLVMSVLTLVLSGQGPTGHRACRSKSPPLTASKTFTAVLMSTRSRRAISQLSYWSEICRLDKTSSTAFDFKILEFPTIFGEPMVGRFRTAPRDQRSVSFSWSGDQAGQGWGIDKSRGGMRTYATILRNRPDFFIHSGDHIYADNPISPEVKLPNGEIWKNLVIEEKTKSAQTLAEFRGNWKYNLLDKNLLAFNAEIPTISQWDDHEILDNWWPGEPLTLAVITQEICREKHTHSDGPR